MRNTLTVNKAPSQPADEVVERKCQNCKFWQNRPGFGWNECRRHAPRFTKKDGDFPEIEHFRVFPYTDGWDWCGDFKRLPLA